MDDTGCPFSRVTGSATLNLSHTRGGSRAVENLRMKVVSTALVLFASGSLMMAGIAVAGPLSTYSAEPVADINPGAGSGISNSVDPEFTAAGNQVFFIADDGVNGKELWASDGRPGGSTQMIKDVNPAPGVGSNPEGLVTYEGEVYFSADDGASGRELWKSNGTEAGTMMLKDIQVGSDSSSPSRPVEAGGKLFFAANEGPGPAFRGTELWMTDGTGPGTGLVKDIEADGCMGGSSPRELTEVDGLLYFVANFSSPGCSDSDLGQLWKSDGTESGTQLISDLRPGNSSDPFIQNITELNGLAVFAATVSSEGVELFTSDGTNSGTVLQVLDPGPTNGVFGPFTVFDGWAYFQGNDGTNRELWRTDGTGTTALFKDLDPTPSAQSQPDSITVANGALWLMPTVAGTSSEPWTSDGIPGGTNLAKDINPGTGNSFPTDFTGLGGRTFFLASNTSSTPFTMTNYQLWQSDGTAGGTIARSSIAAGDDLEDKVKWLAKVGPRLVFGADNNDGTGFELWSFTDNEEPLTTITSGPANNTTITDPSPVFGFESDDLPATFECRLYDSSLPAPAFGPCSGPGATHTPPAPLSTVNEVGSFRFEVRAFDESGNVDPTPVGRTFTLDVKPPDTEITAGPAEDSTITSPSPTFEFRSVNQSGSGQSGATFECRLFATGQSAPAFGTCSGPGETHTPASPLAKGSYTFEVRSTDPVGNTDPTPASRSFAVEAPVADKTLKGSATAWKVQRQRGKRLGIKVKVKAIEALRVALSGKVIDGRRKTGLKRVTNSLKPGASRTIVLRLPRKKNRALLARVRRTGKVRALVAVTLSDPAGNRKQIRLSVKLR